VELDADDHFVLGVQWHPERTYKQSEASRKIFDAFLNEARRWESGQVRELAQDVPVSTP
jgi:putative glutamine amidotransferase